MLKDDHFYLYRWIMTDVIFQKIDAFISIILAAQLSTCDQISAFFLLLSFSLSLFFERKVREKAINRR